MLKLKLKQLLNIFNRVNNYDVQFYPFFQKTFIYRITENYRFTGKKNGYILRDVLVDINARASPRY